MRAHHISSIEEFIMAPPPSSQAFLHTISSIPKGQTRSFGELATMAGKPGAARAAGRAVASCPLNSPTPWHHVVSSHGALVKGLGRAAYQLKMLQEEGARPAQGESNRDWAQRLGVVLMGCYAGKENQRVYAFAEDLRVDSWPATLVEWIRDEDAAVMRGFRHIDAPPFPEPPLPHCTFENLKTLPKSELTMEARLDSLDWRSLRVSLMTKGFSHAKSFLTKQEVSEILSTVEYALTGVEGCHRNMHCGGIDREVNLSRFGGGHGKYYYLKDPLPGCVESLRSSLYEKLRDDANALRLVARGDNMKTELRPGKSMRTIPYSYPCSLEDFFDECRNAGQNRPSVILLCYGKGGINIAHRDLYGPIWYPLQAMVMLSQKGVDYEDLLIFCSSYRLDRNFTNLVKVGLHHGMQRIISGQRFALGIAFHLAK
eukprot:c20903_g2_i1 orf=381-1664(-)